MRNTDNDDDWERYVAWQQDTNSKVFEVGPPPDNGFRWWHGIVPALWFLTMVALIVWAFVLNGIIGLCLAAVFWCQCQESS